MQIQTIFAHEKSSQSPLLRHLQAANPHAVVELVKHNSYTFKPQYQKVSTDPKDHFREKKTKIALLHREAKWKPDPNGNSTDFLPGNMVNQGCGFGCTYCYTERHYTNNFSKVYDDIDKLVPMVQEVMGNEEHYRQKMLAVAKKDFEKHRDDKHGNWITFDLGCDSDCVLDNRMTAHDDYPGHVIDLMNQISLIPNAKTSFATKSSELDDFIKHIARPSHHRIRLSLMPEHHRKVLEINTSTIVDRLIAVNQLVDTGFEVHLNLSPIVVTNDYQKEYRELLELIDNTLSQKAKDQLAYEIIYVTHTLPQTVAIQAYAPKAARMITEGPLPLVAKNHKPNVFTYSQKEKKSLKAILFDLINSITPYSRIRYCY